MRLRHVGTIASFDFGEEIRLCMNPSLIAIILLLCPTTNHRHSLLFCPQDKVTKVSVITALIVAAVANILLVVAATIAWNNCKLIHILVH